MPTKLKRKGGPGRNKLPADQRRITRSISLLPQDWARLDGIAKRHELNRSQEVERMVTVAMIDPDPSCFDCGGAATHLHRETLQAWCSACFASQT